MQSRNRRVARIALPLAALKLSMFYELLKKDPEVARIALPLAALKPQKVSVCGPVEEVARIAMPLAA